jgi:hypothetical protein
MWSRTPNLYNRVNNLPGKVAVAYEAFLNRVSSERCGPLSCFSRPTNGEQVWEALCTVDELLDQPVHPVSYLANGSMNTDHWNHPLSRRVLFRDALERADFVSNFKEDRFPQAPQKNPIPLLLLHCSACDNSALIDGNHRLTRAAIGERGSRSSMVSVLCVSGADWAPSTPDLNRICSCLAP